jgi:hypothetical protein
MALAAGSQTVTWGGEHVRMDVTTTGAVLEFDCAHGAITESLPEKDATFSLKGTFTPERSGPARGDGPKPIDATYSGTVEGDTMTIHITLAGADREVAQYVLGKGNEGTVRKCR